MRTYDILVPMARGERDSDTGLIVEQFSQGVKLFNPQAARNRVSGVAFDFDETITRFPGYSASEHPIRPQVIKIIEDIRRSGLNTMILTSASASVVARKLLREGVLEGLRIEDTWGEYLNHSRKIIEKTGYYNQNPYTKFPTIFECNVLVDDAPMLFKDEAEKVGYSVVQVRAKGEIYEGLREALKSLGVPGL